MKHRADLQEEGDKDGRGVTTPLLEKRLKNYYNIGREKWDSMGRQQKDRPFQEQRGWMERAREEGRTNREYRLKTSQPRKTGKHRKEAFGGQKTAHQKRSKETN